MRLATPRTFLDRQRRRAVPSSDLALAQVTARWPGALKILQEYQQQCGAPRGVPCSSRRDTSLRPIPARSDHWPPSPANRRGADSVFPVWRDVGSEPRAAGPEIGRLRMREIRPGPPLPATVAAHSRPRTGARPDPPVRRSRTGDAGSERPPSALPQASDVAPRIATDPGRSPCAASR